MEVLPYSMTMEKCPLMWDNFLVHDVNNPLMVVRPKKSLNQVSSTRIRIQVATTLSRQISSVPTQQCKHHV